MSLSPYQIERLIACQDRAKRQQQALGNAKEMSAEQLRLALFHAFDRIGEMHDILLRSETKPE
ncbi:hypothetical protein AO724_15640 [Aeromonas allosaccharophila]|uniref:hypothetical protein n=1 Tax=Aeromonas allosaccharophila TaxID=656 RepID=UPI000717E7C6|nr:hypothetical protein [Aeromonas allosaccharophila]KRW60061.1 hypothetical protein AO724_15640 [Aeromonas allosaccharophila]